MSKRQKIGAEGPRSVRNAPQEEVTAEYTFVDFFREIEAASPVFNRGYLLPFKCDNLIEVLGKFSKLKHQNSLLLSYLNQEVRKLIPIITRLRNICQDDTDKRAELRQEVYSKLEDILEEKSEFC